MWPVVTILSCSLTHKHNFLSPFPSLQRLDPGSVCLRHLQFLAGSRARSRDRGAVGDNKCSHLPVELQQPLAGSWGVPTPASHLPKSSGDAPEDRVHWVGRVSKFASVFITVYKPVRENSLGVWPGVLAKFILVHCQAAPPTMNERLVLRS